MNDTWDEERARLKLQREKYVSLGLDWAAFPTFWDKEGSAVGLDWVPIPAALCERFVRWWHWYENRMAPSYISHDPHFDWRNPPFPDLAEFAAEGHAIATAIKRELPDWRIAYTDFALKRDVEI
jgi:hypothetical protein